MGQLTENFYQFRKRHVEFFCGWSVLKIDDNFLNFDLGERDV